MNRKGRRIQPKSKKNKTTSSTKSKKALAVSPDAIKALQAYLVRRYASGDLYATDVAELAWHLVQCQLPFKDLAVNPSEPSFAHNSSRKVQAALGFKAIQNDFSILKIPVCNLENGTRFWKDVHCFSVAEVLGQEFMSRPEEMISISKSFQTENWASNPYREAGENEGDICIPCGVFIDGAAWAGKGAGTRDSVLATYLNVLSERAPYNEKCKPTHLKQFIFQSLEKRPS